ncbi:Tht1-like nuclear fusion protein-domain-containing protein [Peziza echinospora]|nr:Tht1-like nuclear fusion protein-domain-containing protein [Peziza echinospora]
MPKKNDRFQCALTAFLCFFPFPVEASIWGYIKPSTLVIPSERHLNPGPMISSTSHTPSTRRHSEILSAHSEALQLLQSLESKSSCHGEATSSLMLDCSTLDTKSVNEHIRTTYAVKLAICEFESTGINYPGECKAVRSGAPILQHSLTRCLKRLEEKPQHWTTLSNNIQNVMALCAASRFEVEKGQLLALHRNVTKIQQDLFAATASQANEVWTTIQTNKDWEVELRDLQAEVLQSLRKFNQKSVESMTEAGGRAGNMLETLSATMQSSQENMLSLSGNIEMSLKRINNDIASLYLNIPKALLGMQETTREASEEQRILLNGNMELSKELHNSLASIQEITLSDFSITVAGFFKELTEAHQFLRNIQSSSLAIAESLSHIAASTQIIESTQSELTASLSHQSRLQDEMMLSIEHASETASSSLDSLIQGMEKLRDTVDNVEKKVYSYGLWGLGFGWSMPKIQIVIAGFSLMAVMLFKGGKMASWGLGLFSAVWTIAAAMAISSTGSDTTFGAGGNPSNSLDFENSIPCT